MNKEILKNKIFWLMTIAGLFVSGLLVWWLIDLPVLVLLISLVILPVSYYFSQVRKARIEQGAVLSWLTTVCMAMVTVWVYQFFDWPPTILQILLLNIQVIMTAEAVFVAFHYVIHRQELSNFLHLEIFLTKLLSILVAVLAPLAAYQVISYTMANVIGSILLVLLWLRITYEIVWMKYA